MILMQNYWLLYVEREYGSVCGERSVEKESFTPSVGNKMNDDSVDVISSFKICVSVSVRMEVSKKVCKLKIVSCWSCKIGYEEGIVWKGVNYGAWN